MGLFDIIDIFTESPSSKIRELGKSPNIVPKPSDIKPTKISDTLAKMGSLYTGDSEEEVKKRLRENSESYKTLEKTEKVIDDPISIFIGNGYKINAEVESEISIPYGAIIFCELLGCLEHSGIYSSHNRVIELNRHGEIEEVSINTFLSNQKKKIYVFTDDRGQPLSSSTAIYRAKQWLDKKRNYNVIIDNCHQFTSGCLTGDFENSDNALWMLKDTVKKVFKTEVSIREGKK